MLALEPFPERRRGRPRAEAAVGGCRIRRPGALVGLGDQTVEIGGLALIVLHVAIEERRDEMRVDLVDALGAPDRIGEPVVIPQTAAHRARRRIEADVMTGALEGE